MFHKSNATDLSERDKIIKMFARRVLFIILISLLVIVLVGFSITLGTSGISTTDAYKAIINGVFPGTFDISDQTMRIVLNLRAPRVLMAVFAGSALAIGGCVTQSILKNPLATPYTLGVSSGAGFGAALSILFGIGIIGGIGGTIANAFIFSLIPIAIVVLASRFKTMTPMVMILCGVAMSYMFSASNTIFQFFGEANAVKSVVFWMVGDLNGVELWNVPYVAVMMLVVFVYAMIISKDMNIMRMGDDTAKGLGVNVEAIRVSSLIVSCLLTATVVSFTGSIGFICLLAPQISRIFVGSEMQYLLPASALMGACLLTIADVAAKTVMAPIMLPVGAITALVGGPMLILLLLFSKSTNGSRN
jgi:iron complex transport system permease protein